MYTHAGVEGNVGMYVHEVLVDMHTSQIVVDVCIGLESTYELKCRCGHAKVTLSTWLMFWQSEFGLDICLLMLLESIG